MSTQQDMYAAGSENRLPMLNKDNYVPWCSCLLCYAKSKPNRKLIYNSIMHGPYVRRMIPEPGDPDREVPIVETFHEQTDEELTEKEVKHMETDDQPIQTILMGLPEDIYAVVDSCETAQEIWFTSTNGESNESYYHHFSKLMKDFKRNKHLPEKIVSNLKFLNNLQPEWSRRVELLIAQKEEAGIQVQAEEFELMAAVGDIDEIEETDKVPVYDSDGSAEVHEYDNCYNNEIFNMFTQEEQYTELLEPISEPHQVQQNDSNVIYVVSSVEHNGGTVEQHPATVKETHEIYPIVNQADARVQNFKIQFLKEVAKLVRDFKSLTNEADESLAKHRALEFEIERLLRAVFSQDIISIMQNPTVVETSDLHTELERMKEQFENCIIKKENEYAKLWNDWYKKSQLGDQKGKSENTPCVSDTLDHLSQKLENENVELEFQNDLLNPVTSNSVPITTKSNVVKHDKVIAPGMFRIDPSKTSRVDNVMPNKPVNASVRINPLTVSQPHVISQENVNSNSNGISSTGLESTAKTRRPQPRSNIKNDRVPSASKSSCIKNKDVEVDEHHRNLLLSKNKKHMSSECNNVKLTIPNDKSEVVCAMCKQCLITANHVVCVLNYVNDMNSRDYNQSANVSNVANQKKHKPKVRKSKKLGSKERLASPTPSKPRSCLRWSPTRRIFGFKGKIIATSESECQSDSSKGDNACTYNP
ncbi:hypothetical protein Tco_1021642 [Tanacetum coccineum]